MNSSCLSVSCPACAATTRQTRAGFNRCGTQRLHCQHCRRYYTHAPQKKGYGTDKRALALKLVVDGTNFRRTARLEGVCPRTVINWVNAACASLPARPAPAAVVEIDELFTFVGHKKTVSTSPLPEIGTPAACAPGLCAWVVSRTRDAEALQPLADQTAGLHPGRYFSDGHEAYRALLYQQGVHPAGST